ncbi:MAG: hypothetical protein IAE95_05355 [Chitinophagaceae bacterium]|nr:hypothetical protein [Chitinophagaceae bacterium]
MRRFVERGERLHRTPLDNLNASTHRHHAAAASFINASLSPVTRYRWETPFAPASFISAPACTPHGKSRFMLRRTCLFLRFTAMRLMGI